MIMTEKRYIYVIEAYGYSDFETTILSHKTLMSDRMFFDIVKKAQELCKTKNYLQHNRYSDYAENMITCLCEEFGFEKFDYPCVYIGCTTQSKCSMFIGNELVEK